MTFEPGQTVDGRYQVKTRLGGNAHGSTYRANRISDGQEVVIKKLHHDPDQGMQQQLHDAQRAQSLAVNFDELLAIEETGVDQDSAFYVLPYLKSKSLRRHPSPANPDSSEGQTEKYFAEDFQWLSRVAKALDYLASQGHIHGDVKPSNILFDRDDNGNAVAYLSDIEIAKPRSEKQAAGLKDDYPGTMAYLAREVFLDRDHRSTRSDQYSLAVTLYEWLAGELPFEGLTGIEMYKAFQKGCTPINDLCPELPQSSADALHRALAEEPEQRFETNSQFAEAFASGLPARQRGVNNSLWKLVAGTLLAMAASILLFVYAGSFFRSDDRQATTVEEKQSGQQSQKSESLVTSQGQPQDEIVNRKTDSPNSQKRTSVDSTVEARQQNEWQVKSKHSPDTNAESLSKDQQSPGSIPPDQPVEKPSDLYIGEQPTRSQQLPDAGTRNLITNQESPAANQEPNANYVPRPPVPPRPGNGAASKSDYDEIAKTLFHLAQEYEKRSNFALAYKAYKESAKHDYPPAQFRLGQIYENGIDEPGCTVAIQASRAKDWYSEAADGGIVEAQLWMGKCYEDEANRKRPQNQLELNEKQKLYAQADEQFEKAAASRKAEKWKRSAEPLESRLRQQSPQSNGSYWKQGSSAGEGKWKN